MKTIALIGSLALMSGLFYTVPSATPVAQTQQNLKLRVVLSHVTCDVEPGIYSIMNGEVKSVAALARLDQADPIGTHRVNSAIVHGVLGDYMKNEFTIESVENLEYAGCGFEMVYHLSKTQNPEEGHAGFLQGLRTNLLKSRR